MIAPRWGGSNSQTTRDSLRGGREAPGREGTARQTMTAAPARGPTPSARTARQDGRDMTGSRPAVPRPLTVPPAGAASGAAFHTSLSVLFEEIQGDRKPSERSEEPIKSGKIVESSPWRC